MNMPINPCGERFHGTIFFINLAITFKSDVSMHPVLRAS